MSPFLPLSTIYQKIIAPSLSAEWSVEVSTSLIPRLSSLSAVECATLLSSIDLVVEERGNYFTPMKSKHPGLIKSILNGTSFVAPHIVDSAADVLNLKYVSFLPLCTSLYRQLSSFQEA